MTRWAWYFIFCPSGLIKAQDQLIASLEQHVAVQRIVIQEQDRVIAQLRRRKRK